MEFVRETIRIVDVMNNCGCPPIPEKYIEFPIGCEKPIKEDIPILGFPISTSENDLKKKIIEEFSDIFHKLLCGTHLDLKILLDEISLIDRNKYESNDLVYSQENILNPVFNELHINLDNITPEQLETLLRLYKEFIIVLKGPKGDTGNQGKSSYQIAVENGFEGDELTWLNSLKGADGTVTFEELTEELRESLRGPQGETGPQGAIGPKGDTGETGPKGETGALGSQGIEGKSAYLVAIENGYEGTVEQWLTSLQGEKGDTGKDGTNGLDGSPGEKGNSVIFWNHNLNDAVVGYSYSISSLDMSDPRAGNIIITKNGYVLVITENHAGGYVSASLKSCIIGPQGESGTSGEDNVIEIIKINEIPLNPDNDKAVNIEIPTDYVSTELLLLYIDRIEALERKIEELENSPENPEELKYFYIGTTKPTSLSEANIITSYLEEQTFTNPSTTEKCYVYVLTNNDKTVNMYDPADPTDALLKAEDISTLNGYKITYLSADGSTPFKIAKGGSIIIKIS